MQANQQEQIILHDLIEGQSVYNNVVFKPTNPKALFFDFHQPLTNLAFHNCKFDRIRFATDTLDNCIFDHCVFYDAYISKNNNYINNTSFNDCIFNEGRIYKNENNNLFNNCVFNCPIFYYYDN